MWWLIKISAQLRIGLCDASRRLPVERVNFIETGIARNQRRAVRCQASPRPKGAHFARYAFQPDYLLQLPVADTHAVERRIVTDRIEIYVLAIARPRRIADIRF